MGSRITQSSFTRGELSPRLEARTNLEQYYIGLKTAKNAIIHQEGGISNRMGFEFVSEAKYSDSPTRLIKFVFNQEQTYILEFGHHYIRFIQNGGYILRREGYTQYNDVDVLELPSPFDAADLQYIKRSQSGDILTLTHPNYQPINLVRYSHYDWLLEPCTFKSKVLPPSNISAVWTGSTSSATRTYYYVVTAVDSNNEESEQSQVAQAVGHREANWAVNEYMTVSWDDVQDAVEYNVYRSVNGIFAYCGTAKNNSFVDDCIEPDLKSSAPIAKNPFENSNYPSCSCYYQQRKIYANSNNNPQTLWASQTAAFDNFNISRPLSATDAVTITMDDRELNEIRHLIPLKDLVVLTTNSEWKVNGTDGIFQANPNPAAVVQSCYGASHVEPVISGAMILFVQAGGSIIRDLGYDYLSDSYDGEELTIFSSHLFEGKQVKYMSYAKEPYRLLWVVFDDGSAVTMTYNKKQKICGWTRIETQGSFESVETVREGQEDVTYFVINRNINNHSVKYIERTKTRIINDAKKAFLLDAGMDAHFSTPVTNILGLQHLANTHVTVLADGGVIENVLVNSDGAITLPFKVSDVVVGLPYEFEFETLNLEGDNTHGLKKIINHVSAKIYKSREDFAFAGDNNMIYQNSRSYESINDSSKLFSKDVDSTVFNSPTTNATIKITQRLPLPLTILSVSATVDVQDNENS